MSWKGDPQATAPILSIRPQGQYERHACFGIVFRKRFVFQPRIFFELFLWDCGVLFEYFVVTHNRY
jgi:hypothetical protein